MMYRSEQRAEESFRELSLVVLVDEPGEIAEFIHGVILVALAHEPASHRTQLVRPGLVGGHRALKALAMMRKSAVGDRDEELLFALGEVIVQGGLADPDLPSDLLQRNSQVPASTQVPLSYVHDPRAGLGAHGPFAIFRSCSHIFFTHGCPKILLTYR